MEALLIVDVQNDFLPGGALAVKEGDKIIPVINRLQKRFDFIVATQDWHPPDHGSFAANHPDRKIGDVITLEGLDQILWPVHCVQGTKGAEFHKDLHREKWKKVIQKGIDPLVDSYSGFFDNNRRHDTGLSAYLKDNGIEDVWVTGLAADYCVKFTVLDALKEGFKTTLIEDATKAVNIDEKDFENAIMEMRKKGAGVTVSAPILD